jgi:hypothetical protein
MEDAHTRSWTPRRSNGVVLKDLNMDRGVDTTIATFKECMINMERTLRFNPDGTPVDSPDVTLRTYRPSQERLRRSLLNTLDTAPKGSPYLRLAEDMRLDHNVNSTTEDIMTFMRDYKDHGHDTIRSSGHRMDKDTEGPLLPRQETRGKDTTEDTVDLTQV